MVVEDLRYTAFVNEQHLVTGRLAEVLRILKAHHDEGLPAVLVFEDATGRQVDFDLRGSFDDVLARYIPPVRKGPGRPKLGVTAREVTLLPRHWDWLDRQRGGASAALRRLVDDARKHDASETESARAAEAASAFMTAMAGDRPGFEEALRALYAGRGERLAELTRGWPSDVREHTLRLALPALHGPTAADSTRPSGE